MAIAHQEQKTDYAAAQLAVTEHLMEQLKVWRHKLISAPAESIEETDRLFAAQIATRLLEISLRPASMHDLDEIRPLLTPFRDGRFRTSLKLDDLLTMIAQTGALVKGHFALLSD